MKNPSIFPSISILSFLTLSSIQYLTYLVYLISIIFACFFAIKHTPFHIPFILIPKITSILFGKYSVFILAHSALSLLLLPSVMDHKGPQYSDTCIGMICYFATNSIRYDSPKILVITLGSHIERFAFRQFAFRLKKTIRIN